MHRVRRLAAAAVAGIEAAVVAGIEGIEAAKDEHCISDGDDLLR